MGAGIVFNHQPSSERTNPDRSGEMVFADQLSSSIRSPAKVSQHRLPAKRRAVTKVKCTFGTRPQSFLLTVSQPGAGQTGALFEQPIEPAQAPEAASQSNVIDAEIRVGEQLLSQQQSPSL